MTPSTAGVSLGEGEPYAIAIDPGDQLAYIVLEAGALDIMTINADGTLSVSSQVTMTSPVAVAIYP
jgi:protein involved in polysaccharide export with SLBB domain